MVLVVLFEGMANTLEAALLAVGEVQQFHFAPLSVLSPVVKS
jgi:hypothetical protein